MNFKSGITGRSIDFDDNIIIINPKQAAFYWGKGHQPITIYPSKDYTTDEPILVFVFKKSATKDLFTEWCDRKKDI